MGSVAGIAVAKHRRIVLELRRRLYTLRTEEPCQRRVHICSWCVGGVKLINDLGRLLKARLRFERRTLNTAKLVAVKRVADIKPSYVIDTRDTIGMQKRNAVIPSIPSRTVEDGFPRSARTDAVQQRIGKHGNLLACRAVRIARLVDEFKSQYARVVGIPSAGISVYMLGELSLKPRFCFPEFTIGSQLLYADRIGKAVGTACPLSSAPCSDGRQDGIDSIRSAFRNQVVKQLHMVIVYKSALAV